MTALLDRGRFYGETTRHREADGLGLSETVHEGGSEAPRHAHEHPYVCLVLRGRFTERFGAHSAECAPGTVVFHPAGEEHADRFGRSGARCFNIQTDARMLAGLEPSGPRLARTAVEGGGAAVAAVRLRALDGDDRLAALGAEAVLVELLAITASDGGSGEERRAPPWLRRVEERLRVGSHEARPRVAALARDEGIHPVYLSRAFRRHLGVTPVEYLQRLRLQRCVLALARTTVPVARIAADQGFADHSHFCRLFRRAYGVSPSHYRTMMR